MFNVKNFYRFIAFEDWAKFAYSSSSNFNAFLSRFGLELIALSATRNESEAGGRFIPCSLSASEI